MLSKLQCNRDLHIHFVAIVDNLDMFGLDPDPACRYHLDNWGVAHLPTHTDIVGPQAPYPRRPSQYH